MVFYWAIRKLKGLKPLSPAMIIHPYITLDFLPIFYLLEESHYDKLGWVLF